MKGCGRFGRVGRRVHRGLRYRVAPEIQLAEQSGVELGGVYLSCLGLEIGEAGDAFHQVGRVLVLIPDDSNTLHTRHTLRDAPEILETYLRYVILFYAVSDGIKVSLDKVRKESTTLRPFSFPM